MKDVSSVASVISCFCREDFHKIVDIEPESATDRRESPGGSAVTVKDRSCRRPSSSKLVRIRSVDGENVDAS